MRRPISRDPIASMDLMAAGAAALARGDWEHARAKFEAVLAERESPEALEGLSRACWWLDDVQVSSDARKRAYRLYRERGDMRGAARLACQLARQAVTLGGQVAVFSGWTQRARRLLADVDDCPEHAMLAVHEAYFAFVLASDTAAARARAGAGAELARRFGLVDLEMLALALEGASLVAEGEDAITMKNDRQGTTEAFDRSHSGRKQSATVERIYRAAFGDDYPVDAQPNAFYSGTTLQRLASALEVGPGQTVVDLGCGHGGPGLWVAQRTGANLIGIDLSPVGVDLAGCRAAELGLSARARFQVGDLTATGLAEASCDAVMSLDVLVFVPDKSSALREVERILRPGGRFAFTTWEQLRDSALQTHPLSVVRESARLADHRLLLEDAGLAVETYAEPPHWQRQQRALAQGIVTAETEVTQEMGAHYPAMARGFLADLPHLRYVFVLARRLPAASRVQPS